MLLMVNVMIMKLLVQAMIMELMVKSPKEVIKGQEAQHNAINDQGP